MTVHIHSLNLIRNNSSIYSKSIKYSLAYSTDRSSKLVESLQAHFRTIEYLFTVDECRYCKISNKMNATWHNLRTNWSPPTPPHEKISFGKQCLVEISAVVWLQFQRGLNPHIFFVASNQIFKENYKCLNYVKFASDSSLHCSLNLNRGKCWGGFTFFGLYGRHGTGWNVGQTPIYLQYEQTIDSMKYDECSAVAQFWFEFFQNIQYLRVIYLLFPNILLALIFSTSYSNDSPFSLLFFFSVIL